MKELIAKEITHPQYHQILSIDDLTYKWDKVENWTGYADSQGINYKKLFDSLSSDGLKHPVMVRKLNNKYRKWQACSRRIIWAKLNGYTHISAYILTEQQQVDDIYSVQYDESYK